MTLYGEREGVVRPILQIAMPRLPRLYAPEGTMHVVARCNNREFYFTDAEDFETADVLGRPLRWFMTQTAKTFHRLRNRCGHFWERRFRACLVEGDLYALAALRYMDRNPVRAGIVEDPATYAWSSCASYAQGAANRRIQFWHTTGAGADERARSRFAEARRRSITAGICLPG